MMPTVFVVLVIAAFILTLVSIGTPSKVPLWVAVLVLCFIELLRVLPLGR